jgi:hypothetical protein
LDAFLFLQEDSSDRLYAGEKPMSHDRFRAYTFLPLEVFIAVLSFGPILVLLYFYRALPDQIPVFLNLRGEVDMSPLWVD